MADGGVDRERGGEAPARLLGLDVGSVRVGVALSDAGGVFAQPLAVLRRWPARGQPTVAGALAGWAADHQVTAMVVGRPLRMSGEAGPAVVAVEAYVASLAAALPLAVIWWDERLTSREAERALIAAGMRREQRRQQIDQVAAALILQSYLDARRSPLGAPRQGPGEVSPGGDASGGAQGRPAGPF